MGNQEYSKRLGCISDEQLQAALDHFGLGRLVQATSIPYGLFGQNLFLTSTAGKFVLRGSPHYDWQFPAEQFFINLLHQRTSVPVPYPYLLDPGPDIFGWSYVIMPRLAGLQLTNPEIKQSLSSADKLAIASAMGANLAAMQHLTWLVAGRYDLVSDTIQPAATSYAVQLETSIRHNLELAMQHNQARTTEQDGAWVMEQVGNAHTALFDDYTPCLVMEDYNENNVVVSQNGTEWKVSGVFDFMTAYFADGEADLSRQTAMYIDEHPALAHAFVAAYVAAHPPRAGFVERARLYMLNDRLIVWEYFQRPAHPMAENHTLREWAAPYLDFWEEYREVK